MMNLNIWQVRLIETFIAYRGGCQDSQPIINEEAFIALCSILDQRCEEWITGI